MKPIHLEQNYLENVKQVSALGTSYMFRLILLAAYIQWFLVLWICSQNSIPFLKFPQEMNNH